VTRLPNAHTDETSPWETQATCAGGKFPAPPPKCTAWGGGQVLDWRGDLGAVLGDELWAELGILQTASDSQLSARQIAHHAGVAQGQFTLKDGREVVIFSGGHGDGLCTDQEDKMNRVDTGSVGITLVEGLEALSGVEDGLKGGNIFDMQSDIFCMAPTEKPPGEDQVLCMVGGGQGRSTPVDPCRCCRSRAN
jgi:hypothetical protein